MSGDLKSWNGAPRRPKFNRNRTSRVRYRPSCKLARFLTLLGSGGPAIIHVITLGRGASCAARSWLKGRGCKLTVFARFFFFFLVAVENFSGRSQYLWRTFFKKLINFLVIFWDFVYMFGRKLVLFFNKKERSFSFFFFVGLLCFDRFIKLKKRVSVW